MILDLEETELYNANGFIGLFHLAVEIEADYETDELQLCDVLLVQTYMHRRHTISLAPNHRDDFLGIGRAAHKYVKETWDALAQRFADADSDYCSRRMRAEARHRAYISPAEL